MCACANAPLNVVVGVIRYDALCNASYRCGKCSREDRTQLISMKFLCKYLNLPSQSFSFAPSFPPIARLIKHKLIECVFLTSLSSFNSFIRDDEKKIHGFLLSEHKKLVSSSKKP